MKTIRIVSPDGKAAHGKNTQVFDDKGNDIGHLVRRVVIDLSVDKVNTAWLEVNATVDVQALVEAGAVLRKCPDCLVQSPLTDITSFGDDSRKWTVERTNGDPVRFTTEPVQLSTSEA